MNCFQSDRVRTAEATQLLFHGTLFVTVKKLAVRLIQIELAVYK